MRLNNWVKVGNGPAGIRTQGVWLPCLCSALLRIQAQRCVLSIYTHSEGTVAGGGGMGTHMTAK